MSKRQLPDIFDNHAKRQKSEFLAPPPCDKDEWGEDADDELLLLASQACENSGLGTSVTAPVVAVDGDERQRQLAARLERLEEENRQLKAERSQLKESCTTREGEVSNLRTELNTMRKQISVMKNNNIKQRELAQIDFNEKLKTAKGESDQLKSELEFKNLEVLNLKMHEQKLNLTQTAVRVPNLNTTLPPQPKKSVSTMEMFVQTDSKQNAVRLFPLANASFPIVCRIDLSVFTQTAAETPIVFSSSRRSQFIEHSNFTYIRKKILNRLSDDGERNTAVQDDKTSIEFYERLKLLMTLNKNQLNDDAHAEDVLYMVYHTREVLLKTLNRLREMINRSTIQTMRELDEKYFEFTDDDADLMTDRNLFSERAWFKNEQSIEARRTVAIVSVLCECVKTLPDFIFGRSNYTKSKYYDIVEKFTDRFQIDDLNPNDFMDVIIKICESIGRMGCSVYYTGLLCSIVRLIKSCVSCAPNSEYVCRLVFDIIRSLIFLRPHPRVVCEVASIVTQLSQDELFLKLCCNNKSKGHCKVDLKNKVVTYSEDTCMLQLLCNNVELGTKYYQDVNRADGLFAMVNCILNLQQSVMKNKPIWAHCDFNQKCVCYLQLRRSLCCCLRKCADLYEADCMGENVRRELNSIMRAGILMLNACSSQIVSFRSHLNIYESDYQVFVLTCKAFRDRIVLRDIHAEALANLIYGMMPLDDVSQPRSAEPSWEQCFEQFSIVD